MTNINGIGGEGSPERYPSDMPHSSSAGTQVAPPEYRQTDSPAPSRSKGIAVAALIVGIVAFLCGWIPLVGILLGAVGITLSVIALVKRQTKALAVTSLILATLAFLTSTVLTIVVASIPAADDSSASVESAATEGEPAADPAIESEAEEPKSEQEPAGLDLATFGEVDERTFALIGKDPDSHVGENLILYGNVFQFDSFTGMCSFMADTAQVVQASSFDYAQNTMVWAGDQESDCPILSPIVEGDHLKMWVTVQGSYAYDTQIGCSTNALLLEVHQVELLPATEY